MLADFGSIRCRVIFALAAGAVVLAAPSAAAGELGTMAQTGAISSQDSGGNRMDWWREARFGMFIHWGLYSIPAGEWEGRKNHGAWIMHTARIPVEEYEGFLGEFNPVEFDADQWVRIAKDAGMKYIVVTSKHHDGFCLFDSKYTEYDVMATPFERDIMKEMADACRREGIKICWYHSIMDWHHPDYLPRRPWEARPAQGADYDRYVDHMKNQLTELVTNYGDIGVLWFDGGWEHPPEMHRADEVIAELRQLQPSIIINSRLGVPGDFDTPEQYIPSAWAAGRDWETCMTMNDHWGYQKYDENWKSTEDLIRKLADIASKGGNFLLNVGPMPDGTLPEPCVERLHEVGRWMKVNGDAIYGTQASPFASLPWGRCTQKALPDGATRLYLHVFDWPQDERLVVGGLSNETMQAHVLADAEQEPLEVTRDEDAVVIDLPAEAPDAADSVVVLDITGRPDAVEPPSISAESEIFVDTLEVSLASDRSDLRVRYTTDGSKPNADSALFEGPIRLTDKATVSARLFRGDKPVSPVSQASFTKVQPREGAPTEGLVQGLLYDYFEGDWDRLPDFDLLTPVKTGTVSNFDLGVRDRVERFGLRYTGFVLVPRDGVYTFYTDSDDGSRLYVGDVLVVDNDGLHVAQVRSGQIALAKGVHPMTVTFFDRTGDDRLEVSYSGPGIDKQPIPGEALLRSQRLDDAGSSYNPGNPSLARPTPQQLEWHDCELGMFIHFAPNTWMDKEYDDLSLTLSEFNPEKLDTDQWVAAAEAMGAEYIIFVAKHAGGFCMWQTDTTDYGVKSTPWRGGKGDVLADLAASCRKRGMRLGVYLSPQDKKYGAGGGGRCESKEAQERYNELYRAQLTEVLSCYGEIFEVWFDGSIVVPVGDILKQYAPDAMVFQGPHATIRWIGNEDGVAPYPAWNSVSEADAKSGVATAEEGDPEGSAWLPNECDARMRNTWFWRTDNAQTLKTIDELMEMYYRSVGHGAVLLLNHTPDPTGLIPEADFKRGAELGAEVKKRFGKSIAQTSGKGDLVELALEEPTIIDHAITMEEIAEGERGREYTIEGLVDGEWKRLCQGTAIGHKKIDRFAPIVVSRVRLRILRSAAEPLIRKLAVYHTSGTHNAVPELASPGFRFSPAEGLGHEKGVTRRDPSDVIEVDGTYYVWYTKAEGYTGGYYGTVWYATSTDGKGWAERGPAVGKGRKRGWDENGVFTPNILAADGKYYLFYTGVPKPFISQGENITKTAIGVAVSGSPDGPWEKLARNPVLTTSDNADDFDSLRVDDTCLIVRDGKYWLYYKGRQAQREWTETKMGVAVADQPTGPYTKHKENPVVDSGHEVLVWPHREGVAALISPVGPRGRTIQYAPDGIHFATVGRFGDCPYAPGAYRPDAFTDTQCGRGITWGISMLHADPPHLVRFDCDLSAPPQDP